VPQAERRILRGESVLVGAAIVLHDDVSVRLEDADDLLGHRHALTAKDASLRLREHLALRRQRSSDPLWSLSEIHFPSCGIQTKERREGRIVIHPVAA